MAYSSQEMLRQISTDYQTVFHLQKVIMSFSSFLDLVAEKPHLHVRNSPRYLIDMFDHFAVEKGRNLFALGTEKNVPIIGQDKVHDEIYKNLLAFDLQGTPNKLIFLHGPNGSAKSSTIETIAHGLHKYSETDDGAVYTFNWIFSSEKNFSPRVRGETSSIGFGTSGQDYESQQSLALIDENLIASKITSEFHENPLFLLPLEHREKFLKDRLYKNSPSNHPAKTEIPGHMLSKGLSKRNQLILENLLSSYDGNLEKVLRHVQVERFFFSRQYRVGISTVEPQMSVDAQEKILTMDKNISNLPSILHNIRFSETHGELVEANRGVLEFSDLLKRPLETFKYLLATVERGSVNLPTSTAQLDTVFFATANEKHLDAFKGIPDFSSFRGRFEFITVPYLLDFKSEVKIYENDVTITKQVADISPHCLYILCLWAIMTRLKQPELEMYDAGVRHLVSKLDPLTKAKLYAGETLSPQFNVSEEKTLRSLKKKILAESDGIAMYEGRFGISPRELRSVYYKIIQGNSAKTITPVTVFKELERLMKEKTTFEFLQFENRGRFHDNVFFLQCVKEEFAHVFSQEIIAAMGLVEELEYEKLLTRYVDNVVGFLKKEKLFNAKSITSEAPSENLMHEIEKIVNTGASSQTFRESILNRIASKKIEDPTMEIDVILIFHDLLEKIRNHYNIRQSKVIEERLIAMLEENNTGLKEVEETFRKLENKFGYSRKAARECIKFLLGAVK